MKLNRTPEEWSKVDPKAVVGGSQAQAENVLKMALQDIGRLTAERDQINRNRDMWRGQVERQAERLTALQWQPIRAAPRDGTDVLLWGACFPAPDGPRYAKSAHVGWWDSDGGYWSTRSPGLICDAILWMPIARPGLLPERTVAILHEELQTGDK